MFIFIFWARLLCPGWTSPYLNFAPFSTWWVLSDTFTISQVSPWTIGSIGLVYEIYKHLWSSKRIMNYRIFVEVTILWNDPFTWTNNIPQSKKIRRFFPHLTGVSVTWGSLDRFSLVGTMLWSTTPSIVKLPTHLTTVLVVSWLVAQSSILGSIKWLTKVIGIFRKDLITADLIARVFRVYAAASHIRPGNVKICLLAIKSMHRPFNA